MYAIVEAGTDAISGGADRDYFSGTAGELRYYQSASRTFLEMDTDGDGVGDLFLRLDGVIDLSASDFVL